MCLWGDENLHSCIYLLFSGRKKKSQLWMGFFHCPELSVHHHEIGEGGRQREVVPVYFRFLLGAGWITLECGIKYWVWRAFCSHTPCRKSHNIPYLQTRSNNLMKFPKKHVFFCTLPRKRDSKQTVRNNNFSGMEKFFIQVFMQRVCICQKSSSFN